MEQKIERYGSSWVEAKMGKWDEITLAGMFDKITIRLEFTSAAKSIFDFD